MFKKLSLIPSALLALWFGVSLFATAAATKLDSTLEFIYADANVDGSSGGHVALKLNETVYHYQYFPDGLFLLVRDAWSHFRYVYNDLENRTLSIAKVELTPATFKQIKDRFTKLYLIQTSHLNVLAGLQTDISLLESMLSAKPLFALPGAGLFSQHRHNNKHTRHLRKLIDQRYGEEFLAIKIRKLDEQLASFVINPPKLDNAIVSLEQTPNISVTPSQQYLELHLRHEALTTLAQTRSLQTNALMGSSGRALSDTEQRRLIDYAASLEEDILSLVASLRPDNGFPLLLATARYLAVQQSLETDKLLVLKPFSEQVLTVSAETVSRKQALIRRLATRSHAEFDKTRQQVFALAHIGEIDYNRLENSAARSYEIQRGALMQRPIRVERERLLPSLARFVYVNSSENTAHLQAKLARAKQNYAFYYNELQKQYRFSLITDNCVTALTRQIDASFTNESEQIAALGGRFEHGAGFPFIPFQWFEAVQNHFRVSEVDILPSYRKRRLAQLYRQEHPATTYLREFNTLSSTIYDNTDSSNAFLLFTDDVFWPRPLYGITNLAFGLATAGVGLLTLPFDGSERIEAGLHGALFSLPELFFFNIRKGGFEFVEDN